MSPGPLRKAGRLTPLLLLGPVVILLDRLGYAGEQTLFVLAAAALVPLSWLIGEARTTSRCTPARSSAAF